jgi:phage terminase small subunit
MNEDLILTGKQQRFCDEYLIDFNGTRAAIAAGYSENTAAEIASENLTKPNIRTYLSTRQKELREVTGINQERVLNEFAKVAFSNLQDYFKDGRLIDIDKLPRDAAAALSSVKAYEEKIEGVTVGYTKEIKTYDKIKALEGLARHLGLFNDKLDILERMPDDQVNELYLKILNAVKK